MQLQGGTSHSSSTYHKRSLFA
uniref:Uncharacterized protein n=1 Tax=Arundo donax TaxID=35708 RepID=A0A0A8Y4X8_ARUDO